MISFNVFFFLLRVSNITYNFVISNMKVNNCLATIITLCIDGGINKGGVLGRRNVDL